MYNRIFLHLIIITICCSTLILSQQKTRKFRGKIGKAMEYQLVHKKPLNENVADVLYPPDNEEGLQVPDLLVIGKRRPNNSLADDKLVTYSDREVIKDSLNSIDLFFSENLQYFGRNLMIKRPTKMDMKGLTAFHLFDRSGELLFEKETELMYDLPSKDYVITNSGLVFAIDHTNLTITAYDQSGNQTKEKEFAASERFDLSKGIKIQINNRAKALTFFTHDFDPATSHELVQLFAVDFQLNSFFHKTIHSRWAGHTNISNDGNVLIWSSGKGRMLESKGTYFLRLSESKLDSIHNLFSTESKFYAEDLVVLSDYKHLLLYDLNKSRRLFTKYTGKDILAYDYAPEPELIFVLYGIRGRFHGETNRYTNVQLKIYNVNEVPAFELGLGTIKHKSEGGAFLSCADDAGKFIFRIGDAIYTYQAIQ